MRQDCFFVKTLTGEYETEEVPIHINCAGLAELSREAEYIRHLIGRKDWTYYYLYKGSMEFSIDNSDFFTVNPSALLVIPPKVPFSYRHPADQNILIYWVHFTGSYVRKLLAENGIGDVPSITPAPVSAGILHQCQKMLDEMKGKSDGIARQRAASAFVLTVTMITQAQKRSTLVRSLSVSIAYIEEHFTEAVSKEALAAMENLSLSRFNLLFHAQTGYSPGEYITHLRMELAKELLENAALQVKDIARRCGYHDACYFSRVFRQINGIYPSDYRLRHF